MGELIGRLHPLIVHLPIGILTLVFILEILSRRKKSRHIKQVIPVILQISLICSLLSFFTGWIMPKEGAFDPTLLRFHFWFAVGLSLFTLLLVILSNQKNNKYYFPCLIVTMLLLVGTGHYGGSLTHGSDHLVKAAASPKHKTQKLEDLLVYKDVVAGIISQKCVGCHNKEKSKGGLRMDTPQNLIKGGDYGKIFTAGNAASSKMIKRIHLPLEEEDHMPPKGKVQMTNQEIKLLSWWIDQGANFESSVSEADPPEDILQILNTYAANDESKIIAELDIPTEADLNKLRDKGLSVYKLSESSPLLFVNLSRDSLLDFKKIIALKKWRENIHEIDLSFSNMNDDWMNEISKFKNLSVLKLQQTKITGKGLSQISNLDKLEVLNLYGTTIDDSSFEDLEKLSALKSVYLWQTDISEKAIETFKEQNPNLEINFKANTSIFGSTKLRAPTLPRINKIFDDSLSISINSNLKNVDIFYTTDGSLPDKKSEIYQKPILLERSTTIKAFCSKPSWEDSEIAEAVYIKNGIAIKSIKLQRPPNEKYPGKGSTSLHDAQKGTNAFGDGKWLGYYGQDLNLSIDLGEIKATNNVVIGALEDARNYIFYPTALSASGSVDGVNFQELKTTNYPIATEALSSDIKNLMLSWSSQNIRFIKLKISSIKKNPEWHPSPGATSWLFVDEIIVN